MLSPHTADMSVCYCVFFFFFQAEDGIRDKLVTGVQTYALPIWIVMLTGDARATAEAVARRLGIDEIQAGLSPDRKAETVKRSEERRVGKEGRSRWSPYH